MQPVRILFRIAITGLSLTFAATLDAQQPAASSSSVVSGDFDEAVASLHLTNIDDLKVEDISLGPLVNDQKPSQHYVPELRKIAMTGQKRDWFLRVTVGNLVIFGESSVPLLVKGAPQATMRFHKPGLAARAPSEEGLAVKEGQKLLIVVENPTLFPYSAVSMRLRFADEEVCDATPDKTASVSSSPPSQSMADPVKTVASTAKTAGGESPCEDPSKWARFAVPQFTPVTLRVTPPASWFLDPETGFPRGAKRKGMLTLHYTGRGGVPVRPVVYEQTLPVEVQFRPSDRRLFRNLARVAWWLFAGAMIALGLRVAVPNYRRKEKLKEQLADADKAIRSITVETALQVVLSVDRMSLDQMRKSAWIIGPSFSDIAARIEQGIETLRRKLEHTRRLDTARGRRESLLDQDIPPTRLADIDRQLDAACEAMLRDQLSDQDWVFVQQRLDAADKLIAEPTEEEQESFRGRLSKRWKSLDTFFGREGSRLKVPESLEELGDAFPPGDALPRPDDADGKQWIAAVGLVRADIQISALEIIREFLFLAPSARAEEKHLLKQFVLNHSQLDLDGAKLLMRRVSEGTSVDDIVRALENCQASIETIPQEVHAAERTRLAVRFRNPAFNSSGARLSVRCEWIFEPRNPRFEKLVQREFGWEIFRCFPENVTEWNVTARFYVHGVPILLKEGQKPCDDEPAGRDAPATAASQPPVTPSGRLPDVKALQYTRTVKPSGRAKDWGSRLERVIPEAVQLGAALLVPLATLAVTQSDQGASGRWWELIGVGFGSEMIRSILSGGRPAQQP